MIPRRPEQTLRERLWALVAAIVVIAAAIAIRELAGDEDRYDESGGDVEIRVSINAEPGTWLRQGGSRLTKQLD